MNGLCPISAINKKIWDFPNSQPTKVVKSQIKVKKRKKKSLLERRIILIAMENKTLMIRKNSKISFNPYPREGQALLFPAAASTFRVRYECQYDYCQRVRAYAVAVSVLVRYGSGRSRSVVVDTAVPCT